MDCLAHYCHLNIKKRSTKKQQRYEAKPNFGKNCMIYFRKLKNQEFLPLSSGSDTSAILSPWLKSQNQRSLYWKKSPWNAVCLHKLGHNNNLHINCLAWWHPTTVNNKSFTVRKLLQFLSIFSKPWKFSLLNFCSTESWRHEIFKEIFHNHDEESRWLLPRIRK